MLGGISGAGMTAFVEQYRPLLVVATLGILAGAFYLTYRPRAAAGGTAAKISRFNKVLLWSVTVVALVCLFFPQSVNRLFDSSDGFTNDMDRIVITIEGMT